MEVKLMHITPIHITIKAIRRCWNSEDRSDNLGEKDKELLRKIIDKHHESTIEHIVMHYDIQDISRGCLQELARHRIASYSVKSTRYTINKDLKEEKEFLTLKPFGLTEDAIERAKKYIVIQPELVTSQVMQLQVLWNALQTGCKNDKLKYLIPESYKTSLIMSINARSFRNFYRLRTDASAHYEIRELAHKMLDEIPTLYRETIFYDLL